MPESEQRICLLDQTTVRLIARLDTELRVGTKLIHPLDRAFMNEHHRSAIYHQLTTISSCDRYSIGERHPALSGLSIGLNSREQFEIYGSPSVNLRGRIDSLLLVTEPLGFKAILNSLGTPDFLRHADQLVTLERILHLALVANRIHPESIEDLMIPKHERT